MKERKTIKALQLLEFSIKEFGLYWADYFHVTLTDVRCIQRVKDLMC